MDNTNKNEYINKHIKTYYKFNKKPKWIQATLKLELGNIYDKYKNKGITL